MFQLVTAFVANVQCGRSSLVLQQTTVLVERAVSLERHNADFVNEMGSQLMMQGKVSPANPGITISLLASLGSYSSSFQVFIGIRKPCWGIGNIIITFYQEKKKFTTSYHFHQHNIIIISSIHGILLVRIISKLIKCMYKKYLTNIIGQQ